MIQLIKSITLQPLVFDVVKDIFQTIDFERTYLRQWLPFVDKTESENNSYLFVKDVIDNEQNVFSIHENNLLIGLIGFNNFDNTNKKAEIGYWLSESKQGQGIITLAVKQLLILGFTAWKSIVYVS